MLDVVLAWTMVAVAGLAFAGFLFGFAALLTLIERLVHQAQRVSFRLQRRERATPRILA